MVNWSGSVNVAPMPEWRETAGPVSSGHRRSMPMLTPLASNFWTTRGDIHPCSLTPSQRPGYSDWMHDITTSDLTNARSPLPLTCFMNCVGTSVDEIFNTQELIAGGYSDGENGNAGPMTPGTFGDTNSDGRIVTLHWEPTGGTQAQAQVQATDPVYNPYAQIFVEHYQLKTRLYRLTRTCPPDLHLILGGAGVRSVDIRSWLRDNHAPVGRIKCVPGENNRDFDDLVKALRNHGVVSLRELLLTYTHSYPLR